MARSGIRNNASPAQVSRQLTMLQALKDTLPEGELAFGSDTAAQIVANRYGYTAEQAPDPETYRAEIELETERLRATTSDRDVVAELRSAVADALAGGRPGVEPLAVVGIAATNLLFRYGRERTGIFPAQAAATCLATVGELVSEGRDEYGQAAALAFALAGDYAASGWALDRFSIALPELEPMIQAAFAIADPSLTSAVLGRLEPGALRTLVETVKARRERGLGTENFWELVRDAYAEDQNLGARRASDWASNLFITSIAAIPGGHAISDNHFDR